MSTIPVMLVNAVAIQTTMRLRLQTVQLIHGGAFGNTKQDEEHD